MPLCYKIDISLKISKEQKKAERGTRYASILNLYNCYKMDTVWARAQNFKIEKTCGRELLTAGLAEMERFELSRRGSPDLPHFECGPFNHLGTSPKIN